MNLADASGSSSGGGRLRREEETGKMFDLENSGVSEAEWSTATATCHALRVDQVIQETHDTRSIVLAIPNELRDRFSYRAGQFLSFKIPIGGSVLVRSYSLSSSPDTDATHKVTIKRVDDGRVSNWMNDEVGEGSVLMVVPPAGLFVLGEATRKIVLFSGGSGITPCISIIKSALRKSERRIKLIYANRDARSIIFKRELEALVVAHADRLEVVHLLDDVDGFLDLTAVGTHVATDHGADFYLCGPGPFMDIVEQGLARLHIPSDQVHIERFISPPDSQDRTEVVVDDRDATPESITLVLDGATHEVPYQSGEAVLAAARRAGLDPPFSCEEGYCSCCMAKLCEGRVRMVANDCLTPELLKEGWVLTCQSRCVSAKIRIEYPD